MSLDFSRSGFARLRVVGASIFLVVVSLGGCGRSTPPGSITIRFACPADDTEYYELLVREFSEEHPDVFIELYFTGWEELEYLEAGDADVFVLWEEVLGGLREQGHLMSLDPFIQNESFDLADFYPGAVEVLASEGRTWAIPSGVDPGVMFYNRDLFDRYDVAYPELGWTWDDFLSAALALRDPEADVYGYGPTEGIYDALPFVYQHGGQLFDSLQDPTRVVFDDPTAIEALEWYAALFQEYDVALSPKQAFLVFGPPPQYSVHRGIVGEQVAIWTGLFSERGGEYYWPDEWLMRWGMVPWPRDVEAVTYAHCEAYAISSQTQHPDEAWQWVVFLSEQMPYRLIPARKSLAQSAAYGQLVGGEAADVARVCMDSVMVLSPRVWTDFAGDLEVLEQAIEEIVNGDRGPLGAMDWARRQAEQSGP